MRVTAVIDVAAPAVRDVRVQLGRAEIGVAEHLLDAAQIGSAFEQVRGERMPQEVRVEVRSLTNGTQLSWKAPAYGTVKGYYILMRETTSAVWQKKIFTASTDVKLPYSKDNYFFAVQSVSENGNESLPVVPVPGR